MSTDRLARSCSRAAAHIVANGFPTPGVVTSAHVLELVNKAVRLGLHLGLNAAEKVADTRFERSVNEALNMGDGAYRP